MCLCVCTRVCMRKYFLAFMIDICACVRAFSGVEWCGARFYALTANEM